MVIDCTRYFHFFDLCCSPIGFTGLFHRSVEQLTRAFISRVYSVDLAIQLTKFSFYVVSIGYLTVITL